MKAQKTAGGEKRKKVIITVTTIFVFAGLARATLVEVSVATDKPTYQLNEEVTVFVTAYNPNSETVTLNGGIPFASYVMDGTYNWADWHTSPLPVIIPLTIQPNDSFTWNMTHDAQEMQRYPLAIGVHTVIGEVLAIELIGDGESAPLEFEVIPEPTTILLMVIGVLGARARKHKS